MTRQASGGSDGNGEYTDRGGDTHTEVTLIYKSIGWRAMLRCDDL